MTAALEVLEQGCTRAEAEAYVDGLAAVRADAVRGRWRGSELPTGHPMDGALSASGWYGKQFDGPDEVHPLLFSGRDGAVFPVEPRLMPLSLAERLGSDAVARTAGVGLRLRPALRARGHRARLREVGHRGVVTAAMVYDHLPIIDVFRRVDDDTLVGEMDLRGRPPYFFVLRRDQSDGPAHGTGEGAA